MLNPAHNIDALSISAYSLFFFIFFLCFDDTVRVFLTQDRTTFISDSHLCYTCRIINNLFFAFANMDKFFFRWRGFKAVKWTIVFIFGINKKKKRVPTAKIHCHDAAYTFTWNLHFSWGWGGLSWGFSEILNELELPFNLLCSFSCLNKLSHIFKATWKS